MVPWSQTKAKQLTRLCPFILPILLGLVPLVEKSSVNPDRTLDGVELFSGESAIVNACIGGGLHVCGYDKSWWEGTSYKDVHDFMSEEGFQNAIDLVLQIKAGGFLWAGPECTTWIWIGRHM